MKMKLSRQRTVPFAVLSLVASLGALLSAPPAYAIPDYLTGFGGLYTGSTSGDNASCQLCHGSSTQTLNPYGAEVCVQSGNITTRLQAVEALNSDMDPTGASNIAEINASAQPGWTPGNVNALFNRGNCSPIGTTEAAPAFISGELDPMAANQPPVADPNGPYSGTVNLPLSFDGTGSSDPDGTIASYSWDFGDGSTGTGPTPTHTYLADGTVTVSLTVTDDAGATGSAATTATIGLGNQPPVADPNGPYTGTVGVAVVFDGIGSSDPDGTLASYSWDFGDGSTGSGATPGHTYAAPGMYNVTLTITDDAGATDSAATTADIRQPANQPPLADPNGPYSGTAGMPVAFDGSASSDPDGTVVSYSWDFGDGSTGSGATPTHTYAADGNYTVTLTVTDDAGDSASATTAATIGAVGNQPPVSDPNGPYSGTVGVPVAFDGSASSDPDGTVVSYSWDFGDGSKGSGAIPTHTYAADGNYTVTLTVTDDAGDSASAATSATIGLGNLPPLSNPNGPYSGTVGVPLMFDGSASTDPDGSIVSYSWDFGDGSTGSGQSPVHTYRADATYHVTLQVTDDAGASDSSMTTAVIAPVAGAGDVYLSGLKVPGKVKVRKGETQSKKIKVRGKGDTVVQDATVTLSVMSPVGVSVTVHPMSLTRELGADDKAGKYRFDADISCVAPGEYTLKWTATISAAQNGNPGNDTLTDTTSVRCRMKQDDDDDSDDDDSHDDSEEEGHDS